jgi:hypothetical protein
MVGVPLGATDLVGHDGKLEGMDNRLGQVHDVLILLVELPPRQVRDLDELLKLTRRSEFKAKHSVDETSRDALHVTCELVWRGPKRVSSYCSCLADTDASAPLLAQLRRALSGARVDLARRAQAQARIDC